MSVEVWEAELKTIWCIVKKNEGTEQLSNTKRLKDHRRHLKCMTR